ncbi:MAG: hypothetical protein ACJA0X_002323, partial [Cyclobacteriaceae bacterium]
MHKQSIKLIESDFFLNVKYAEMVISMSIAAPKALFLFLVFQSLHLL